MKLAVVCDYSLKYTGGAQTALMAQVRAWARSGEVVLIAPDIPDEFYHLPNVRAVNPPRGLTLPGVDLPLVRASATLQSWMRRTLKAHGADAVMVHSEFALAASALEQAAHVGIPSLHTVHTFFWRAPAVAQVAAPLVRVFHRCVTGVEQPRVKLAQRPMDSALRGMTLAIARLADTVVSPSAHQAERLQSAGLTHVEVLSNVAEVVPGDSPVVPGTPLKLLWIGRFAPEKRLDVALEAVRLARDMGAEVDLTVAGGDAPGGFSDPHVHFLGVVKHAEVVSLIDASHATLLTSCGFDNQPMVVLESAARGRPTLVSDPVLAVEFGDAAIGASGTTATDLAETIVECAKNPARLTTAGRAASRLAQQVSGPAHVEKLRTFIAHMAKQKFS